MENFLLHNGVWLGLGLVLVVLFMVRLRYSRRKDQRELWVTEEALVHRKSDTTTAFYHAYWLHFYIAQRDTVVIDCQVSRVVWQKLNKGDRGMLTHQGNTFLSFERDGELIQTEEPPGDDSATLRR